MLVKELIEQLQKMPQDAKVIMVSQDYKGHWDLEVRDVIYNDPARVKKHAHTVELDNWPAEGFLR